jgi:uncharacterized protein YndB with AHSA1/START domain
MTDPHRARITIERTFRATIDAVWDCWTTPAGLEAWWGPEGFTTRVLSLDLRPGGELRYEMTATDPQTIAFMRSAGMPVTTSVRLTYTAIEPRTRLAYINVADFVPGVAPYDVATEVAFRADGPNVHLTIVSDPMHDDEWTARMTAGHQSQLGKLERHLADAP